MTESELVQAARSGDQRAFGKLVEQHYTMVYNLALRMVGNPEDAADLTQEAFLSAWRSLASFQSQSAFSTWLYRLTSNACIDFLRREKRRGALSLTTEDEEEGRELEVADQRFSPERELEKKEAQRAVREGLLSLSPEHRQVLLLRETQGLSYAEIAQCLSLEEGTVKSRISRGRKKLRAFLLARGNFSPPPPSKETGKGGRP